MVEERVIDFGALIELPAGYFVVWSDLHEHYMALGPNNWESDITCDRWQARRWALNHFKEQTE